eukprot:scaffold25158_cov65-Phaeocystis_antarctica.AAC.4
MEMTSTTRAPLCTTPDLLLICATREATSQVCLLVVDRQGACAPRWRRLAERAAHPHFGFVWRSHTLNDGDTWTDESTRQATISCDDGRRWRAVVRGRALPQLGRAGDHAQEDGGLRRGERGCEGKLRAPTSCRRADT